MIATLWLCGVWCMSMVSVCVGVAVRADAGGVGRPQRELDARRGASPRRQRPAAQVLSQRLRHAGARRDRTLPTPPYTGFLSYFCLYLCSLFLFFQTIKLNLHELTNITHNSASY